MGCEPCKMDPDAWLKDCGENHECISVHVDDLPIASKDPQCAVDALINKHYFKLKITGPICYNLRCNFGRDKDSALNFAPKEHAENT